MQKRQPKTALQIETAEEQIVELSKRIEFYLTEYSVELLANKMKNGELVVPHYQREYTWEPDRKSRFIESLLMGLPIPFLFFWEMPSGKLEIVDGSQRLRTIQEFLSGELFLGELESLTALTGFGYFELPESRRRKINNRSIRGIVLNEHADEQARFDMFERINTGSKIANKAEVRRGALAGPFMSMLIQLSNMPEFEELAPVSKKDADEREREELVARFFAYSDGFANVDGFRDYKDRPSEYIFKFVKERNIKLTRDPGLEARYRGRFVEMIDFVKRNFPFGFRKTFKGNTTYRARFEAIAVGVRLALDQCPGLKDGDSLEVTPWLIGDDFQKITGADGANAINRLRARVEFVRDRLVGAT